VWDDESPGPWDDGDGLEARRGSRHGGSRDVEGEDIVPYFGGGEAFGGVEADSRAATGGPRTAGGRTALLIVLVLVSLATLLLCCVAISQAGRLLNIDPTLL
jgi:hypothetical protein